MKRTLQALAACLLGFVFSDALARSCFAGDWPQILGPGRNGKAIGEKLANSWPAAGPKLAWKRNVGSGYAGVAVADGKLVLWHRVDDESIAEGLDARSGKSLWTARFPTNYSSTIAPDNGPRCVPLIDSDRVFLVGAQGDLHCVSLTSGRKLWDVDAFQDFGAPEGYFGAGSTPLVVADKLILNVGGKGAGVVAFSTADGSVAWKSTDEAASYSSPVSATIAGQQQVIAITRLTTIGVNPANGEVLWQYPFGSRGPTVNAATPLLLNRHLFLSASYGIGARWMQLSEGKPRLEWESDEIMSSQYTTCVEQDGILYGIDGRQDQGVARLRAIDPVKQKVLWTEENFGPANLILADGKLLILTIDGELALAKASPLNYLELARVKVLDTTAQALPALADGTIYVRDTDTLKAFSIP